MFVELEGDTNGFVRMEHVELLNDDVNDNENAFDMEMSSDFDVDVNVDALEVSEADVSAHHAHRI